MTGKEDLFTYEEVSRLAKRLEEETIETRCELTKYKRAFEILKRTGLRIVEYDADEYSQYLMFTKGIDTDVEPEEAELLEELMNNENI